MRLYLTHTFHSLLESIYRRIIVKNMTPPKNNSANQQNANKGTNGTNKAYDKNQGNRGWQMNPQNPANKSKPANNKK